MIASRMKATAEELFPISWELHNSYVRLNSLNQSGKSGRCLEYVCAGLIPVPECDNGDPQDNYIIPFISKEIIRMRGPGIGRGEINVVRTSALIEPSL